jgi:hypothetical protein
VSQRVLLNSHHLCGCSVSIRARRWRRSKTMIYSFVLHVIELGIIVFRATRLELLGCRVLTVLVSPAW